MPGTCDSRPTRSPAAATWNGWRDISWHQAVSPRVVGSCRAVSTSARLTPHASAKRIRSEEHTSELQSPDHLVCRLLLEKKKKIDSSLTTISFKRQAARTVAESPFSRRSVVRL